MYKPVVTLEKCCTCEICSKGCPAEILPELREEKTSFRGTIYEGKQGSPFLRDEIHEMPPCQQACPISQDVKGYIGLIAKKRWEEALSLIRETNALPSVTGYVCPHPCATECIRNRLGDNISIRALKRFVAEFVLPPRISTGTVSNGGKKVAIIGSGPAGLSAAYYLARIGYQVEINEASSEAGGMLFWAIPPFRLPREVLSRDIEYIKQMGVTIKTNRKFGVDVTFAEMKRGGIDAIILAIGTQKALKLELPTKEHDSERYLDSLTFLLKFAEGGHIELGDKVVVVGGGDAAIDSSRVALRCGAKEVMILYRRGYEDMPARKDEIKEAESEGVNIRYFSKPIEILEKKGKIGGLRCVKTKLGEVDESGRRKVISIKHSEFCVKADSIISAIGQIPDMSWNQEGLAFRLSLNNTFAVDENCMTNIPGVFAAGDGVNGPTSIIEAMGSGKRVARYVDLYLSKQEGT